MSKLTEWLNKIKDKWRGFTKGRKAALIVIPIGILCAIIALMISLNARKYAVLFSNMNDKDLGAILSKLKEKKIEYKVEGKAIKVPKEQVDLLRLEMASEVPLTNGSVGFEIFDQGKFGATDEEMKIKYQRALEGELERTLKGLPEVEDAKVHLVVSEDSVFIKDPSPASASLTLRLKSEKELQRDQVKAIVALLCSSVKNLDKKNVEIVGSNSNITTLLTPPDLFNEEGGDYAGNTEKQEKIKKDTEKRLEEKIQSMLEKVYGKSNVVVKVNAALNFDAVEENKTDFAPKGTVVSEHTIADINSNTGGASSNSPVDNNMTARAQKDDSAGSSGHKDETKNYEISKSEKKTIKAPGEVLKISTSVLLNGNIDENTKSVVNNLVVGAIGYEPKRGDTITVEALKFDKSIEDKAKKDLAEMQKLKDKERKQKIIKYSAIGAGALAVLLVTLIIALRRRNKDEEEIEETKGIDMVIGDEIIPKEPFEPIVFEEENEKTHIENEIKNYATEKPDQVAEIIKSWIAEDER